MRVSKKDVVLQRTTDMMTFRDLATPIPKLTLTVLPLIQKGRAPRPATTQDRLRRRRLLPVRPRNAKRQVLPVPNRVIVLKERHTKGPPRVAVDGVTVSNRQLPASKTELEEKGTHCEGPTVTYVPWHRLES